VLPSVRVCVLTTNLSADTMMAALSVGANGYVVKDVTPNALIDSIKAVGAEGFYADPRLSAMLLKRNVERAPHDLSPRELDVVRLIAQGLSNKEIGSRLLLSDKTIKNHVANIFTKLNVNARTQVAIYALRNKIV
jgi:two-component system response regulator DegU